jgi:hypothetical protein
MKGNWVKSAKDVCQKFVLGEAKGKVEFYISDKPIWGDNNSELGYYLMVCNHNLEVCSGILTEKVIKELVKHFELGREIGLEKL